MNKLVLLLISGFLLSVGCQSSGGDSSSNKPRLINFDAMTPEIISGNMERRMVSGKHMTLATYKIPQGTLIRMHKHPSEQFMYVQAGLITVTSEGQDYQVVDGDILIIPSNVPHQIQAMQDTELVLVFSPPRKDWENEEHPHLVGKDIPGPKGRI